MRTIRSMVRGALGVAVAAVMLAAAPGFAAQNALDILSDDAQVVLVVPNPKALSDKLAKFANDFGIPSPEMQDVLGEFKKATGMQNGLREDGPMIVVLTGVTEAVQNQTEPKFVVLAPVTDYAAFVGNFGGDGGAAIAELTMPAGDSGFAKKVGQYAAFGQDKAVVEAYQPANNGTKFKVLMGAMASRYFDGSDVAVLVELSTLGPALQPKVDEGLAEMRAQLNAADPNAAKMMEGMATMYGEAVNAFLRDAQSAVFTADLDDAGIGSSGVVQWRAGSPAAKHFATAPGSNLLSELPRQPYMLAGWVDYKALGLAGLMEKFVAALPEEGPINRGLYADAIPMIRAASGQAFAWYSPQQVMGPGLLSMVNVYQADDAGAFVNATKAYIEKMNNVAMPMGIPDEQGNEQNLTFTTSYQPAVSEMEGVKVDQYALTYNLPPAMMEQMGPMAPMMMMMMGGAGYQGYIAHKDNHVVQTTVVDPMLMTAALQTVGKGQGLGADEALAAARQELPPGLVTEMHISASGIVSTINGFMMMFGGPQLNVDAAVPPISFGMGVQDDALGARYFVPTRTIRYIYDVAMAAQAQMGGIPGGNDDGEGAPPAPF